MEHTENTLEIDTTEHHKALALLTALITIKPDNDHE